jgi:deoxyribodipyrimidine photo-lyase
MKSVFIFRRDFRLFDNKGFIECYKKSDKILPIFIFTPEQIENNEYFSSNGFQFMIESLESLNKELKEKYSSQLNYYYGNNLDVINELLKNYDTIHFNMDYTPYAVKRDESIKKLCNDNEKEIFIYEDYLLMPIGTYLKEDSSPYLVYGPFKKKARTIKVSLPDNYKFEKNKFENTTKTSKNKYICKITDLDKYYEKNPNILVNGGRENALTILKNIKTYVNYSNERNNLILSTTHLSAYIKFGSISIREVSVLFLQAVQI